MYNLKIKIGKQFGKTTGGSCLFSDICLSKKKQDANIFFLYHSTIANGQVGGDGIAGEGGGGGVPMQQTHNYSPGVAIPTLTVDDVVEDLGFGMYQVGGNHICGKNMESFLFLFFCFRAQKQAFWLLKSGS